MSVYQRLLRVLPRRFRERHGEAMHQTFLSRSEAARGRGPGAWLLLWAREVCDLFWTAVKLRSAPRVFAGSRSGGAGGPFAALALDFRLAVRSLARSWRFGLAFVAPLAIALGAGAAFYGIIDHVLYRPPPGVTDPDRLVRLAITVDGRDPFELGNTGSAWLDYEVIRRESGLLEEVAAFHTAPSSLGRGERARRITTAYVTASFFDLSGVVPRLGRFFVAEEDQVSTPSVPCVVSDRFWRADLGGTSAALGRSLVVGALECTVVGVVPPRFHGVGYSPVDVWIPLRAGGEATFGDAALWSTDGSHWLRIFGRLADGASMAAVEAEATGAYRSVGGRLRDPDLEERIVARPLLGAAAGSSQRIRMARWMLAGSVSLMLLVAANLVNLLVARNMGRAHDTGVRVALGARWWRLLRLHLIECALLAAVAGLASLAVVRWVGMLARAALFTGVEFAEGPLTMRVVAVAIGSSFLFAGSVALVATGYAGNADPVKLLTAGGAGRVAGSRSNRRLRLALVAVQSGLSVALLLASTGFTRSFRHAVGSHLGFEIRGLIQADVPRVTFDEESRLSHRELMDRLHELALQTPGVRSASLGYTGPWWNNRTEPLRVPGRDTLPLVPGFEMPLFDAVTPDYLATFGLEMRAGRWLSDGDVAGSPAVMVVNEALAKLYWPGEASVLGRCIHVGEGSARCREIVGVVGDHRLTGGLDDPTTPAYFLPVAQAEEYRGDYRLFVRAEGDADALLPTIRSLVQGADPDLPAALVQPVQAQLDPSLSSWRVGAMAFTALGVVAAVVAAIGLFSVLAYMVAERSREFAIRGALGGDASSIVRPVLRQGITVVVLGSLAGGALAGAFGGWLEPLLFQVELLEPAVVAAVLLGVISIGVLAAWGPARRAARADPLELLRSD